MATHQDYDSDDGEPDLIVSNVVDPMSWTRALETAKLIAPSYKYPVKKVVITIDFSEKQPVIVTTDYAVLTYGERQS